MEADKKVADVSVLEKLDEVKLDDEENVESIQKVDEKLKRNSLSKFWRFKSMESIATSEDPTKMSKTNTLMRLFTKKDKAEKKETKKPEVGSEATARPSFLMRGLLVPWISRQPSHVNLQKPVEAKIPDDDENSGQEIATSSVIF